MAEEPLLPVRVLHDFVDELDRLKISYMLTGSMAMFHYTFYRMTADVDMVLDLDPAKGEKLIAALDINYYVPHDSARRAIASRRMFNVLQQSTAYKIDCAMVKDTPFHKNAFARRQLVNFESKSIYIITIEDLILSKLWWAKDTGSEKQMSDVKNLLRNETDLNYIEDWAEKLDVSASLAKCIGEIGQ